MTEYNQNSHSVISFHNFPAQEEGSALAGYAALIDAHNLRIPLPAFLSLIGKRHKRHIKGRWHIYTPRHRPEESLQGHLTFALKNEGIDLCVLKALFIKTPADEIAEIVGSEPTGRYSRQIWFLYEWLCGTRLDIEDTKRGSYVPLVNAALQYPGPARDSRRHRIRNNLPGSRDFCPIVRRTEKLDRFINLSLSATAQEQIGKTHADLISRAAAFLMLKDSKASYAIEGESPPHTRIERWGRAIGQAGSRSLSIVELENLQRQVLEDFRFVLPGLRGAGGFVGEHDRVTGQPMPDHISARAENLESLLNGMIETYQQLKDSEFDAVLLAGVIAFGFVFIHPFEDGNGRLHRYLLHHVLADTGFVPRGLVFPVSSVFLDRITDYRTVLEEYSKPRLDLIEWRPTPDNNVEVLNETIDLYRYFDGTAQAEFLYECVEETVNRTLPEEVDYLKKYDELHGFITSFIEMPGRQIDLLIRFLNQNQGKLSQRAKGNEFSQLTPQEIEALEDKYDEVFAVAER
mgnify:FL=1